MDDKDTLEIALDENGAVVAFKGHTTKKNWKRHMNKLKEVLTPK